MNFITTLLGIVTISKKSQSHFCIRNNKLWEKILNIPHLVINKLQKMINKIAKGV